MSIREYFKPVAVPTNTDTYLEIGSRRWEGWPATILFIAIFMGPFYLALFAAVAVMAFSR